jgi:hypothetical protein
MYGNPVDATIGSTDMKTPGGGVLVAVVEEI